MHNSQAVIEELQQDEIKYCNRKPDDNHVWEPLLLFSLMNIESDKRVMFRKEYDMQIVRVNDNNTTGLSGMVKQNHFETLKTQTAQGLDHIRFFNSYP